jgi:hypothetical protein
MRKLSSSSGGPQFIITLQEEENTTKEGEEEEIKYNPLPSIDRSKRRHPKHDQPNN